MKIFIIHRFSDKKQISENIQKFMGFLNINIKWIFLNSASVLPWKKKAIKEICLADCVLVFNKESCEESENAKWEMSQASKLGEIILEYDLNNFNEEGIGDVVK